MPVPGVPDKAVGESRERVRAALAAVGLALPPRRIFPIGGLQRLCIAAVDAAAITAQDVIDRLFGDDLVHLPSQSLGEIPAARLFCPIVCAKLETTPTRTHMR